MKPYGTSISGLLQSIKTHHDLIWQMTKRAVIGRYKGSIFGLLWSFLNPLIFMSVYTFAFGFVFKQKWGTENETKFDFAITLFASLTVFNFFADQLKEGPTLVTAQSSYVKRVVFPLEILPVVSSLASLFHAGISLLIFAVFFAVAHLALHWTLVFVPVVIFPLMILALGCGYFLASLGVYVRDVGQLIGHVITILLFVSPVFFSIHRLPPELQILMFLNPLAPILEQARNVMVFGQIPSWPILSGYTVFSFLVLMGGYWWFQKTRKGFADVL